MKLNRKLVLILSLVLSLALATGGTLAYLTDRDSAANVFTIGNVDIDLNEDFDQGVELIPGVDIPKEATVTNTGKNDAWVWATVAIPAALDNEDASKNVVHFNYPKESVGEGLWTWTDEQGTWLVEEDVEHDGVKYNVYTVLYQTALKPGETTPAVISKVYMDTAVDIAPDGEMYKVVKGEATKVGWNVNTDGNPVMHVAAYAMQMDGFATVQEAYAAYNTQWTTTEGVNNGIEWGVAGEPVENADALNSALADGGLVLVEEDVAGDVTVAEGVEGEIALQDNTLTGTITNAGDLTITGGTLESDAAGIWNTGDVTLNDVTVNAGSTSAYALVSDAGATAVFENVDLASAGGGIGAANGAQVTFKSGTVDVNSKSTSGRYLFYAEGEGTTITIEGGEFSFNKTQNQKRAYICAMDGATVYVKGGTFGTASTRSGYTAGILTYGTGKVIITGGTFGFDPTTWVADGYTAVKNADNTWTVTK